METIADLNNFAVAYIDANRLREAVDILALGLQFTRNQRDHLEFPNDEEAPPPYPLTSFPSLTGSMHVRVAAIIMPKGNVQRTDFGKKPFHFSSALKYHHPFWSLQELKRCTTSKNGSTMTSMSKSESHTLLTIRLATMLIFNCALCHEFLASSAISSSRSKVLRDKATFLYGKVVNLFFESTIESCLEEDSMDNSVVSTSRSPRRPGFVGAQQDIMVMAAVNNMIQLHHEPSQEMKNYSQLMMTLFQ